MCFKEEEEGCRRSHSCKKIENKMEDKSPGTYKVTNAALQRLRRRMETIKKHHSTCEARFEKEIINPEAQMSDNKAASTSGSIVHVLDDAPPLIRTDSVYLTKAMLRYKTDDSITSIDNSEDDYVPRIIRGRQFR
ncbi:uncharacterized protein LOC115192442 isoform X3 [Salmo trutta]|uniref:uncharacterized protein LOC115192442 isoform X3 n=1 Tax=Salmo trutta TaxID=8032 RepID=UPI0011311C3D|nr:uncharacterized protein LOC115192442 isoform X3 [Salmo trutta]